MKLESVLAKHVLELLGLLANPIFAYVWKVRMINSVCNVFMAGHCRNVQDHHHSNFDFPESANS